MEKGIISNVESLRKRLIRPDRKFFVLAGSALSGKCYPNAPMVSDVFTTILENIHLVLSKNTDYGLRVIGEYAKDLASGSRKTILESTKFEAFLGFVEECTNQEELQELLRTIYYCTGEEYGHNQKALSWLMRQGYCAGCLTTNFDNSIELAAPDIKRYFHPQKGWLSQFEAKRPFIYKLHGDAKIGNCISTNRQISKSRLAASHQYVETILKGQTLWAIGYSGFGDLDISVHIKCKTLLWGIAREDARYPEDVDYPVKIDLSSSNGEINLLLGLAEDLGYVVDTEGAPHSWKEGVRKWCATQRVEDLARIVVLTLFGQTNWPMVHILNVAPQIAIFPQRQFDMGLACLQVSAYHSALPFFRRAWYDKSATEAQRIRAHVYLGFCLWRLGELDQAMDFLWIICSQQNPRRVKEVEIEIANGIRIYLETARDKLLLTNNAAKRKEITRERKLIELGTRLLKHGIQEIKTDIFNRIVIAQIQFLDGAKGKANDMVKHYEDAISLQEYGLADACARALTTMDLSLGWQVSWQTQRILRTRGQGNQIRKSNITLLFALTGGKFPFILDVGDGPKFAKLFIHKREKEYKNFIEKINKEKEGGKTRCH